MRILKLPSDYNEWLTLWKQSQEKEPFSHPGYVALYADEKTAACAAVHEDDEGKVFYPFLLRDLRKEAFWPEKYSGEPQADAQVKDQPKLQDARHHGKRMTGAFDIISPYAYGGPELICSKPELKSSKEKKPETSHEAKEKLYPAFYKAFDAWARETGVVSEFVRFSLFSDARPYYYGTLEPNNVNVVCRLQQSNDKADKTKIRQKLHSQRYGLPPGYAEDANEQGYGVWAGFRPKVRWMARKALKKGLMVVEDASGTRQADFLRVYYATMDRLNARAFYYFDKAYFDGLQAALGGRFRYFHTVYKGNIVSSLLALCSNSRVYLFLLGGLHEYFHLSGNNLVLFHSIMWAQKNGYQDYVFGGGYKPYDGIFNFKKSFAPNGLVPFYTGKMVFDKEAYRLLKATHPQPSSDFFPEYRSQ